MSVRVQCVGSSRRRGSAHVCAALVLAGCALLRIVPPERATFYPDCPIHRWLHILCPGCGATRALAALLRGHVAEALHWNALFVLLLPFALGFGLLAYRRVLTCNDAPLPRIPTPALAALLTVAVVFAVFRNTPGHGF